MSGLHFDRIHLDCRSLHLSEILVVCGNCLGKSFTIEFFFFLNSSLIYGFRVFLEKLKVEHNPQTMLFFNAFSVFMNEKLWPLLQYH